MPKKRVKPRKKIQSRHPVKSDGGDGFAFLQSPWAMFFGA